MASSASEDLYQRSGSDKAALLRKIADNLEARKMELVGRAALETGLPSGRFEGETARTCGQLRLFAGLVEEGSWVDARIDPAIKDREPVPRPDIRSMRRALGPVAVFCASNFPIAFSVAGGDTASALAAGCPVIVNAHVAHPGTSEIAAEAVSRAVVECGFPEGTFSLLFSRDYEIGAALAGHPLITAIGFTGSRTGGRALMDIASKREEPIPVFAEMSSVNPVFVLPGAAAERSDAIAEGLFASITLGHGQFCTKPGLIFLPKGPGYDAITAKLKQLVDGSTGHPLLTKGIRDSFVAKAEDRGSRSERREGFGVDSCLFEIDLSRVVEDESFASEIFGPAAVVIGYGDLAELGDYASRIEGQLTASFHASEGEVDSVSDWVRSFEKKAGRLIFNGYPTGVEVSNAMVHGGPYPAASNAGSTSVGTRAIERYTRLVCYQDAPEKILPDELKDGNPRGILRVVDGRHSRKPLGKA